MPDIVISDSTCLIGLERIGRLDILRKLYGEIVISEAVQREVGLPHLPWVNVVPIKNQEALRFLKLEIDEGEAATIILATEIKESLLILDEKKARKIARRLDLKVTGLMGVLMKAKEKGIIESVKELITRLEEADFRILDEIKQQVLRLCGE